MSINFQIDPDPNTVAWDFDINMTDDHYMMAEFVTNTQMIDRVVNFDEFEATLPFYLTFQAVSIEIDVNHFDINDEDLNCCICWETRTASEICQLNCNHQFCEVCTLSHIKNNTINTCPLCRENITKITVQTDDIYKKFN